MKSSLSIIHSLPLTLCPSHPLHLAFSLFCLSIIYPLNQNQDTSVHINTNTDRRVMLWIYIALIDTFSFYWSLIGRNVTFANSAPVFFPHRYSPFDETPFSFPLIMKRRRRTEKKQQRKNLTIFCCLICYRLVDVFFFSLTALRCVTFLFI